MYHRFFEQYFSGFEFQILFFKLVILPRLKSQSAWLFIQSWAKVKWWINSFLKGILYELYPNELKNNFMRQAFINAMLEWKRSITDTRITSALFRKVIQNQLNCQCNTMNKVITFLHYPQFGICVDEPSCVIYKFLFLEEGAISNYIYSHIKFTSRAYKLCQWFSSHTS